MQNLFSHTPNSPYHLSAGAVLFNGKGEIACHHFDQIFDDKTRITYKDFYILMRETVEPNESLEQTVIRGLKEEFGATGKIKEYLGAQSISFARENYSFYKTTLYFLVELEEIKPSRRLKDDPERGSKIEWQNIDFLINKMGSQVGKEYREDMNEAEILERAKFQLKRLENK